MAGYEEAQSEGNYSPDISISYYNGLAQNMYIA